MDMELSDEKNMVTNEGLPLLKGTLEVLYPFATAISYRD